MNIGDICNRIVASITVDETAQEAAELMRQLHVGTLVVTESDGEIPAPVGIITDRDLVIQVMAKGEDARSVNVSDIMSDELLMAEEGDDVGDTLEAMEEAGVRRVPVVDSDGALIGVLALDDVLRVYARDIEKMAGIVGSQRLQESEARA